MVTRKPSTSSDEEKDLLRGSMEQLLDWATLGSVGTFVVKRTHRGDITAGTESVIKMHELPGNEVDLIRHVVRMYNSSKMVIICDGQGEPDRIEVYRFCNLR